MSVRIANRPTVSSPAQARPLSPQEKAEVKGRLAQVDRYLAKGLPLSNLVDALKADKARLEDSLYRGTPAPAGKGAELSTATKKLLHHYVGELKTLLSSEPDPTGAYASSNGLMKELLAAVPVPRTLAPSRGWQPR